MITGDKALSPNNLDDIKLATSNTNTHGSEVKVILISQSGSEGLDFKFIRQVHILEPWYNTNRIEQIIGRAVRTCSHKDLPFEKRNVQLYLHGSIMSDKSMEPADMYIYRLAEMKALQIGYVSRALKEISVDCLLNSGQLGFTIENMNQTVKQELSSGKIIDYQVGDRPYTSICDYMDKCTYTCSPDKELDIEDVDISTYSKSFMNIDKIITHIKSIFKEKYFFEKEALFQRLKLIGRNYSNLQIDVALTQMIKDKNEFLADKYGRLGHLVNIDKLYLFQPIELESKHISMFDRSVPLDWKSDKLILSVPKKFNDKLVVEKTAEDYTKQDKIGVKVPDIKTSKHAEATKILDTMGKNYVQGLTLQTHKLKSTDNWYKFYELTMRHLEQALAFSSNTMREILVEHIVDELLYLEYITVINYLEKGRNGVFENMVYEYMLSKQLTDGKIQMIILCGINNKRYVLVLDKDTWREILPEENKIMAELYVQKKSTFTPSKNKLNKIMGFIAGYDNSFMTYKLIELDKKRNKGKRCDQINNKPILIELLNNIVGQKLYTEDMSFDGFNFSKTIYCVISEVILRYYDKENKNGKSWFLSPGENIIVVLQEILL